MGGSLGFGYIDLVIVIGYLAGVTLIGVYFRQQANLKDYFLGGRTAPWWAISFSLVATETSTLTIIGAPAIAYGGSLVFLQLVVGYALARIIIAFWLLPHYFKGDLLTAYGYIERRFGAPTRRAAAGLFILTRTLSDAVRLWAVAIVVLMVVPRISLLVTGEEATVTELTAVLVVMGLTMVYTYLGGMKAVLWTDVVQFVLYLTGGAFSLFYLLSQIPGGWSTVTRTASAKFTMLDLSFDWSNPFTFWAGVFGGLVFTLASHGTDQMMVQRILAARNLRDGQKALIFSGVFAFLQFAMFLTIGILLFVFYAQTAPEQTFASNDQIFPSFMVNHLPPVLSGFVIAGVLAAAMSTASSSLNSLASSSVADFYMTLRGGTLEPAVLLRAARWFTVFWGIVLVGVASLAQHWGDVLQAGLAVATITYGPLLGLFLLGSLTRSTKPWAATAGMLAGLAVILILKFGTVVAWPWFVPAGSAATFVTGWSLSLLGGTTGDAHE